MSNLLVPKGTNTQRLAQVQMTFVDNGVIVTKAFIVEEAGKAPQQAQQSLVFLTLKDALENLAKEV